MPKLSDQSRFQIYEMRDLRMDHQAENGLFEKTLENIILLFIAHFPFKNVKYIQVPNF